MLVIPSQFFQKQNKKNDFNFFYQKCLGSVQYLGEPIKEIGFDLGDTERNYCDGKWAQFEVSVKGPKDKGTVYFWAQRADDQQWIVNRLELELNSMPDKRLIVQKAS